MSVCLPAFDRSPSPRGLPKDRPTNKIHGHLASKSSILILLVAVAITASPLRGLVHSYAPEDGSGHAHQHSHDGSHHAHHHHHHDGDDEDDPSPGSDHHSTLDDRPDVLKIAWTASRRIEVATPTPAHLMVVLTTSAGGDRDRFRPAKPPPWLPARSNRVSQLRTVILRV